MWKRIILTLFMIVCLVLGECGSSGDSRELVADEDYGDTADYEDDASSDTEDIASEEYEEEETSEAEDGTDDDTDTSPAEAKGIVAMMYESTPNASHVQLITIDPDTGVQEVFADFPLKYLTSTEITDPSSIDDTDLRYLAPFAKAKNYGNRRNSFSEDLTKMAVNRVILQDNGQEVHAGWVDSNGEFFDVSEATGLAHETDFANPDLIQHSAVGFNGGMFVFDTGEDVYFQVPVDDVRSDNVSEISIEDWFVAYTCQAKYEDVPHPTSWIDKTNCIADVYGEYVNQSYVKSVLTNMETGEIAEYIPESERYNWSGVLSPDGNTVAFFSTPKRYDGLLELYTVSLSGGEPMRVALIQNLDVLLDLTTLTVDDAGITTGRNPLYDGVKCYLLDWR